jgi:hypothetical protein
VNGFRCLALLLAAACGSDSATATFDGTVRGQAMQPKDAVSSPATVAFTSGSLPVAAIVIGDVPQLCGKVSANVEPKSSRLLLLFLADANTSNGAIQPAAGTGVFPVFTIGSGSPPAHFAVASFGVDDDLCRQVDSANAISGSVTLGANAGGAYTGIYDLTFDTGDRVSGSFHTTTCQGLPEYFSRLTHGCG